MTFKILITRIPDNRKISFFGNGYWHGEDMQRDVEANEVQNRPAAENTPSWRQRVRTTVTRYGPVAERISVTAGRTGLVSMGVGAGAGAVYALVPGSGITVRDGARIGATISGITGAGVGAFFGSRGARASGDNTQNRQQAQPAQQVELARRNQRDRVNAR